MNEVTNDSIKCDHALSGLYNVYDPEIGLNVVDLGLIYEVNFEEDTKTIHLVMTLTTQFCPMGQSIQDNVTESVNHSFPDWTLDLSLTFEPAWSYEKISPEGLKYLGH